MCGILGYFCGDANGIILERRAALEELDAITNGNDTEMTLNGSSDDRLRSADISYALDASEKPLNGMAPIVKAPSPVPFSQQTRVISHRGASSRRSYEVSPSHCSPFDTTRHPNSQGITESVLSRIHTALERFLLVEAKAAKKKIKSDPKIKTHIQAALVKKADLMERASVIFDIPEDAIHAHYNEAAHYGYQQAEERKAALEKDMAAKIGLKMARLSLRNPAILDIPQVVDADTKPGVPNFLLWVSDPEKSSGCCFCPSKLAKLRKLNSIQMFSIGEMPATYHLTEQPRAEVLYVRHPNLPGLYIPSSGYQRYLSEESISGFIQFLSYLGATKAVFETGEETSLGLQLSSVIEEGHVDVSATITPERGEAESMNTTIDFEKKPKGWGYQWKEIESLPAYHRNPHWKQLADLRRAGSCSLEFAFTEDTSGINRTSIAREIIKMGFEGSVEETKTAHTEIKCRITFTPKIEYENHTTVLLDSSGYETLKSLDSTGQEMVLFAYRYAERFRLNIPDMNRVRLEELLKLGVTEKRDFSYFLHVLYSNISQGPDGLIQVLVFQRPETLSQFLEYSLPEDGQKFAPAQQAVVSEVVNNMLRLSRQIRSSTCDMGMQVHDEPLEELAIFKQRIFRAFLNISDDLSNDKIAFDRSSSISPYIDMSREPTADTVCLMRGDKSGLLSHEQPISFDDEERQAWNVSIGIRDATVEAQMSVV
jgi:hypothetical protein